MNNLYFTNTLMIRQKPPELEEGCPNINFENDEAIKKIHRFCHEIYNIPVTWLVDYKSMLMYKDLFKEWAEKYGDEVGFIEWGIYTNAILPEYTKDLQPWVELAGIKRPDSYNYKDELTSHVGFFNMTDEDIDKAVKFITKSFKDTMGFPLKTFANAFIDNRSVGIFKKYGIKNIWAHNWNYFQEGIDNKGCPPEPFFVSQTNHNTPSSDNNDPVAVHWGAASFLYSYQADKWCRMGASYCLNVMELTNHSYGMDQVDYHRKVIREYAENAKWNPIIHIPLQIETNWIDESQTEGKYVQWPTFNSGNIESYYTEIEECLKVGAKPITVNGLGDFMRENIEPNHKTIFFSEDLLPDLRHKGKDSPSGTFLIYKDLKHQYWFSKDNKFNFIKRYDYEKSTPKEVPYVNEPDVILKEKSSVCPTGGIKIVNGDVFYELSDLTLSSKEDYKDYGLAFWEANIPDYVKDKDIETGGFIKDFTTVREKNTALIFGDLKKGENTGIFRSDKPKDFIKVIRREKVGKRFEIWIENTGSPTDLIHIEFHDMPNLILGGYWWNGKFNHTLYRFGWCDYHYESGFFRFKVVYPQSLKLDHGLNRFTLETH